MSLSLDQKKKDSVLQAKLLWVTAGKPIPQTDVKPTISEWLEFLKSLFAVNYNGVFAKLDHSANIARIVLVDHTIGSVVDLNFW